MVQVIDLPRPLSGILSQQMAQGLAKNLPQPEQLTQRRMLSQAFEKAKKTATQPGASPLDLAFDFLQATAGIPGAERYVGQVLPLVMQRSEAQRGAQLPDQAPLEAPQAGAPPPSAEETPAQTTTGAAAEGKTAESPTISSHEYLKQAQSQFELPPPGEDQSGLFANTLNPIEFGMGPVPSTYSPDQIAQAESEDLQRGFPQSIRAQRMREYNDLARKDLKDMVQGTDIQGQLAQQKREQDQAFRNVLSGVLNTDDPLDLALGENIANKEKYRNIANDVIRADKVKKEYDLTNRNLNSWKKASARPNPYMPWSRSQYEKNFRALRENAKPLVNEGMRAELYKNLLDKGWTQTESEQILNPLGNKLVKSLNGLPNIPQGPFPTAGGGISPKAQEREQKITENRLNQWQNFLGKNIKAGKVDPKNRDVFEPGTSLILLRNEFMKKGGNYEDFERMLLDLRGQGKINLDKFQENEMNVISQRPIHSWTIEEFFFGTKSL